MAEDARTLSRYVRPIYDAIDNRQYKTAIKLCQHKKVAHLDIVQVLRAHCLERTGKVDEALALCRAVQQRRPTEETLLNTMYLVFRLSGCEHEMLPTFEDACARVSPPSEELYLSLFGAYVRQGDFLRQQQTALKMFKEFGGLKYMSWAALSMVLQVQHGGAPAKILALAERMLLKALRDAQKNDGEALQLLVHILQLEEKHSDALAVFDEFATLIEQEEEEGHDHKHGPGCQHDHGAAGRVKGRAAEGEGVYDEDIELGPMQTIDRLALEAELSKEVQDWERCKSVYSTLLREHNADDWTFLKEYTGSALMVGAQDLKSVEEELLEFFSSLEAEKQNARLRGPRLVRVHLQRELIKHFREREAPLEQIQQTEAKLVAAIIDYMERFYSKTCCFSDLKQYLSFVSDTTSQAKDELVSHLRTLFQSSRATESQSTGSSSPTEGERAEAMAQLNRRLLTLKSLRFMGDFDSWQIAQIEALVKELVTDYENSSWLNLGSTGGQREVQYTDDLLLIAVHFMLDLFQRDPKRRHLLVEAAALLEHGLDNSAYNFQMKLLLCRVYAFLGAGEAMINRHAELDVKHVQMDSLAFLTFDKLLALCHFPESRRLCDNIQRLHMGSASEIPEYTARAYRYGVYSKVLDMTSFLHQRMRKSHTLAMAKTESINYALMDAFALGSTKLHDFLTSADLQDMLQELLPLLENHEQLSPNHHREVAVEWTPRPLIHASDSFQPEGEPLVEVDRSRDLSTSCSWMKLELGMATLMRAIAQGEKEKAMATWTLNKQLISELHLMREGSNACVMAKLWTLLTTVTDAVVECQDQDDSAQHGPRDLLSNATTSVQELQTALEAVAHLPSPFTSTSSSEHVILSPFGLAAFSTLLNRCGLWLSILLTSTLRSKGKKKAAAKRDEQNGPTLATTVRSLLKAVHELHVSLAEFIKSVPLPANEAPASVSMPSVLLPMEKLQAAHRSVHGHISTSHRTLQTRLTTLLHDRATVLKTILQKQS